MAAWRTTLVCIAMMLLIGCRGTTAGGTPYTIELTRELSTYLGTDIQTAQLLSQEVLENELLYSITHESLDGREGVIEADTAEGEQVRVQTFWAGNRVTRLEILVGLLGDEAAQLAIANAIQERLRIGSAAP